MREEQRMYFLALCRAENMSAAAGQLHISRQGLSKSIAALEQEIGAPLFRRTRRGVAPTEAGALLKDCLDAQDELWEGFLSQVQNLRPCTTQTIRVGLRDIYCSLSDKQLFYSFRRTHPDVAVETRDVDFDDGWEFLQDGMLDFALSMTPPPAYEFCQVAVSTDEQIAVLMSEHNPLARQTSVDFDQDLRGKTVLQPSAYCRRLYLPYYKTRGIALKYVDVDRNSMRAIVSSCDDVFIAMAPTACGLLTEGLTTRPLANSPLAKHDLDSCILFRHDIAGPARELLLELCAHWGVLDKCLRQLEMR